MTRWLKAIAALAFASCIGGTALADRDGSGTYTVPNTFVAGTTITASDHNENWSDVATEMTNSLPRDGQAGMTGQFKAASGSVSAPGIAFLSDADSGFYRIGTNNIGLALDGALFVDFSTTAMKVAGDIAILDDSTPSHYLTITAGSNLTADRILTLLTGDAARTLTIGADSSISGTAYVSGGTDVAVADGGTGASTATAGFDALAPTTTRGDLIVRGATNNGRLAVGTSGQVLTSDGTDAAWAAGPSEVLLTSGTVTNAATQSIVLTSYTAYRSLKLVLTGCQPATDGATLYVRTSTDGGSNYDAGASDYGWNFVTDKPGSAATTPDNIRDEADGQIQVSEAVGNASTESLNSEITLYNQTSTAFFTQLEFRTIGLSSSPVPRRWNGVGVRLAAADVDAIRFLFSSGNIDECKYAVIGLK